MTKNRVLDITDCLATYSSKDYPRTLKDLHGILTKEYGMRISLGTLRKELEFLVNEDSSVRVMKEKSKSNYRENVYYLVANSFALHEIRYLMDAVSAAKFISPSDTRELVYKLRSLTDEATSKRLANELVTSEGKVTIDHFSDNIQTIHEAIKDKKCLLFQYGRYNVQKEFVLSRNGELYEVIPYGVVWNQEYYYLIGQELGKESKVHYRIDRMNSVAESKRAWAPEPGFDLEKYVSQLFFMYPGESKNIAVEFDGHLINVVIDRFGLHAKIKPLEENRFLLECQGTVSQGLVRWLLTWGADAKVLQPAELIEMMKQEINRFAGLYN